MKQFTQKEFILNQIGTFEVDENGTFVRLAPGLAPALAGLEAYSHVNIYWWFDESDNETCRNRLLVGTPHPDAPPLLGVFATRSPDRPNPVAVTTAKILQIDPEAGWIQISHTEAYPGSPVIDIKPYSPGLDRVEAPKAPRWGGLSVEASEKDRVGE